MTTCTRVLLVTYSRFFHLFHSGVWTCTPQKQSGCDYQRLPTCQIHGYFSALAALSTLCIHVSQLIKHPNINVQQFGWKEAGVCPGGLLQKFWLGERYFTSEQILLLLPSPAPYSTITLPFPRYLPQLHHPLSSHPLSPKGANIFPGDEKSPGWR